MPPGLSPVFDAGGRGYDGNPTSLRPQPQVRIRLVLRIHRRDLIGDRPNVAAAVLRIGTQPLGNRGRLLPG